MKKVCPNCGNKNDQLNDDVDNTQWCKIGCYFRWEAPHITGCKVVEEKIISYTDGGFLHTAHNCPVYETKFDDLHDGKLICNI